MQGKTHVTIGLTAVTTTMACGLIPIEITPLIGAIIGSLLPDIDHDKATINSSLNINKTAYVFFAAIILYFKQDITSLLIALMLLGVSFSKHRALTHSLLALGVLTIVSIKLDNQFKYALIIGYGLHLMADYFTNKGIEIFFPYKKRYSSPITISTGKTSEKIIWSIMSIMLFYNAIELLN